MQPFPRALALTRASVNARPVKGPFGSTRGPGAMPGSVITRSLCRALPSCGACRPTASRQASQARRSDGVRSSARPCVPCVRHRGGQEAQAQARSGLTLGRSVPGRGQRAGNELQAPTSSRKQCILMLCARRRKAAAHALRASASFAWSRCDRTDALERRRAPLAVNYS